MTWLFLGVALTALGLMVGLAFVGVQAYVRPRRTRSIRTPADVGLAYEAVQLRSADGIVAPAWYVPPRNGAVVILVHGLGANREYMLDRAAGFATHGFGCLLLDLRAHGDSVGGRCSIGYREVAEVRAAVDYLLGHPAYPPERIGILGESLGGSVALLAAAEIPELEAVVVDSTFCALDELVAERFEAFIRLPRWLRPLTIALGEWQTGVRLCQVRPVDAAARLGSRPLLIIHGGRDSLFPPQHAERLLAAASGPTELWLVPEASHAAISCLYPQEYTERLLTFFEQGLGVGYRGSGVGGQAPADPRHPAPGA